MKCVVCNVNDIFCKNKCQKCYKKEWYKQNKDTIDKKNYSNTKKYNESYKGKKLKRIYKWKSRGLIDSDNDNYEKIHQRYIDTTNCDLCNIKLTTGKKTTSTRKEMEHDHKTGLFRNIVCHKCNNKIKDIETPSKSNTGLKNISYWNNYYRYSKEINKVRVSKSFKELDDAICYSVINDMIIKLESQ